MPVFVEAIESRTLMSAVPAISTQQIANLQKLGADLKAIHAKSNVTTAQWHQLGTDLATAAKTATKPSAASVNKLIADGKAAAADHKLGAAEKTLLTTDVQAVLRSANVSPAEAQAIAADCKVVISASGVTTSDVQTILGDLKAIANTLKSSHA